MQQQQSLDSSALPECVTTTYNGVYSILNLDNNRLPKEDLHSRIYRSAILSIDQTKLFCMAPSKSLPNDTFFEHASQTATFVQSEIIEGTMINLFWNGDEWEITTRKRVGGRNFFFNNRYGMEGEPEQKTFREMFADVLDLASIPFDRSYCYSFVLQHPSNHIVSVIESPKLYLVYTYKIDGFNYRYVNPKTHPNLVEFMQLNIHFPREFLWNPVNGDMLENHFVTFNTCVHDGEIKNSPLLQVLNHPLNLHTSAGIMITNQENGHRTTYYTSKYLEAKALRGNNPNLHYQYLMLRKVEKVDEFLRYFPLYHRHFDKFLEHFNSFKERIHQLYWEVHVKKTKTLENANRDRYFVEKLHFEVYLPRHRVDKKFFITKHVIEQFFDGDSVVIPLF